MAINRPQLQSITERERELARAEDLARLRQAYTEGKASGDGEAVRPQDFLAALKAERANRG